MRVGAAEHDWLTVLFVPADQPPMLRKAQTRGARALMVDLEDAIAPERKVEAREILLNELAAGSLAGESRIYVRVNPAQEGGMDDAEALRGSDIAGLMLPKTESPGDLALVRAALGDAPLALIPQIETAAGLLGLSEVLDSDPPVAAVAFGGEDFAADLGVPRSAESVELLFPRAWLAICARAAGVPAIDTVFTDFDDETGLRREAALAAQLGFSGKLLIHPDQIEATAAAFAPTTEQLDWARRVLAARSDAEDGGVAKVDGSMVDAPVLAQAERILARAPRG